MAAIRHTKNVKTFLTGTHEVTDVKNTSSIFTRYNYNHLSHSEISYKMNCSYLANFLC